MTAGSAAGCRRLACWALWSALAVYAVAAQADERHCAAGEPGSVEVAQSDDGPVTTLIALNRYFAPVHLSWQLQDLDNAQPAGALTGTLVIPSCERQEVTSVAAAGSGRWSFGYGYRYLHGDPAAEHRPRAPYLPPFAAGTREMISQAWPDTFTHTDAASAHAVDFELEVGTPVHAAREGTVFQVAAEFVAGGEDAERYADEANFVRVLHDDGSMALYAHLDHGSVEVNPGQRVRRGERLAASGNTGFTTGPHLHFAVQVNRDGLIESVPLTFIDADGAVGPPVSGEWLTAGDAQPPPSASSRASAAGDSSGAEQTVPRHR